MVGRNTNTALLVISGGWQPFLVKYILTFSRIYSGTQTHNNYSKNQPRSSPWQYNYLKVIAVHKKRNSIIWNLISKTTARHIQTRSHYKPYLHEKIERTNFFTDTNWQFHKSYWQYIPLVSRAIWNCYYNGAMRSLALNWNLFIPYLHATSFLLSVS